MSLIDLKRDELEQFINDQMIGPGGCAWRFGKQGLPDNEEVLNTTPGSVYNTAILFPKKSDNSTAAGFDNADDGSVDANDGSIVADDGADDVADDGDVDDNDNDNGGSDGDDGFLLERRFPNAMAISCCLAEGVDLTNDVRVRITGRYYRKISGDERRKVFISISQEQEEDLLKFLKGDRLIDESFIVDSGKLSFRASFSMENVRDLSNHIKDLNRIKAESFRDQVKRTDWGASVFDGLDPQYLFLSTCRRKLFDMLQNRNTDRQYALEIRKCINIIGEYEQFILDLEDLVALYHGQSYGFWESKSIDWYVDMASIPFDEQRRYYSPSQDNCDALKKRVDAFNRRVGNVDYPIEMSLSVLFQVIRDHRNDNNHNKYLKVMLQNSTTPFIETIQDHYTIVNEELNKVCFFGIRIAVESDFILPYRKGEGYLDVNKEEDRLKFIYRNVEDYGVGHLCSVDWDRRNHNKVWSSFLPTVDIPDVDFEPRNKRVGWIENNGVTLPPPFLDNINCLNLHRLSTFSNVNDDQILNDLNDFVSKYQEWIDLLPRGANGDTNYERFAEYTIAQCQLDCDRMRTNIGIILGDKKNIHSFRLMNSAMLMQMWHNKSNFKYIKEIIKPDFYFDKGTSFNWRPFQLAFILLNLDGIVQREDDPDWKKRSELVDLVWFPTGGGKTEAYLGLIALTIINRRRNHGEQAGGTTAIMRYTLRLLATQQFGRALKLILALDQIRIWGNDVQYADYYLGKEAVSIGLFVGKNSLPNSYAELDVIAGRWNNRNQFNNSTSNIPLDKCPWCGGELAWTKRCGGNNYKYRSFRNQFNCQNTVCTFNSRRLPVQLCDEQIYSDPPTLLFGTVDKFAQLARKVSTAAGNIKSDSRRLFGRGEGIDYLTPDLIIQDELHLLLGPLGSAVSLFEAAIDQLCTRFIEVNNERLSVRPKIISSTATTRNTELQICALYDRGVNIFPKSGVDYDDSFFAFYKRKREGDNNEEWISKRRYKGIMPTGRTQMLMQLRLAAILFVHRAKFEKEHWREGANDSDYNMAADNYYSIISYFNSLKEVGKTDAQYPYEFTKYLQRLYLRVIGHCGMLDCFFADENTLSKEELTGRLSGPQVVSTLDKVQRSFDVNHRLIHLENNNVVPGYTPPDYILATNMISVGIDVDRFNTIIMNSMPRNVAEYIQASSRVARKHKGLVLTSHNPYRIRDVSHFEKYMEFHEKMYYYVDPISITPFSSKAVDKYLPLYLATIIRHRFNNLQNNRTDATNIVETTLVDRDQIARDIVDYFHRRMLHTQDYAGSFEEVELSKRLSSVFTREMEQYVERFVNEAFTQWVNLANGELWYYNDDPRHMKNNRLRFLFTEIEDYDDVRDDSYWTVPNSLRIVEQEAVLKVKNLY